MKNNFTVLAFVQVFCILWLCTSGPCSAADPLGQPAEGFTFTHTKSKTCGKSWLLMEKLIAASGDRCSEVISIQGFPYLRGTVPVLEMARHLNTGYACHKWIELLRRIDLQARYAELSMLPQKELGKFCAAAGIKCFQGRIRAYVARCSAIIMGDEKRNHDFIKRLKDQALKASRDRGHGMQRCFQDEESLDGLVTADVLDRIISAPKTNSNAGAYLQQRIQRSKQLSIP